MQKQKDKAEQGYYANESSATEYTADRLSYETDCIKDEGIHNQKTADEIADLYGFNKEQRQQLCELLAEENNSLWSAVLYGISVDDGGIVTVVLSQVGNVGGQPYCSWYGFDGYSL